MSTSRNKFGLSRKIGEPIKRQVRQECGYGCVICGSAIYHYHHFDPPFTEARKHDPSKIALLCGKHHQEAEGFISQERVAEAREKPYCKMQGYAHIPLEVSSRDQFEIRVGNTTLVGIESIIKVNNETLLALHRPEEPGAPPMISAKFFDRNGLEVASIVRNEWFGSSSAFDIEATVGGEWVLSKFEVRKGMSILW